MIAQIQTIDNEKKLLPIAGSQPSGNPVGSLLFTYRKLQPRNYLYCDGSTFNASQYPALALYLGSNVLPDYRECGVVGAEENTTDTIANHDVYTEGEFKDDQNKSHRHSILAKTNSSSSISNVYPKSPVASNTAVSNADYVDLANYQDGGTPKPYLSDEGGDVARGKRKAVFVYIKAVDGVDVTDEDTFLNTVKNYVDDQVGDANSYSTAETLTGGKWVDNKPIYKRVFQKQCGSGTTEVYDFGSNTYIDTVVSSTVSIKQSNNSITLGSYYQGSSDLANIYINASGKLVFRSGSSYAYGFVTIILEYTKSSS